MSGLRALVCETCDACEGTGAQLWFYQGRARFPPCVVCAGFKMITWMYGAAPFRTLVPEELQGSARLVLDVPRISPSRSAGP